MAKADNLFCRRKTGIVCFSVSVHTSLPRRTRRTAHLLSGTAAFLPFISWMRHLFKGEQRTRYVACIPKGYRTMLAIHNQFTPRLRNRLKTTGIGLGLVRLLQDARRFEDARTVLSTLENGFQGSAE